MLAGAMRTVWEQIARPAMKSAFLDDLYRRHSRSVFRYACALMGDRDSGKDVMQDVFLRAFEARAEFTSTA